MKYSFLGFIGIIFSLTLVILPFANASETVIIDGNYNGDKISLNFSNGYISGKIQMPENNTLDLKSVKFFEIGNKIIASDKTTGSKILAKSIGTDKILILIKNFDDSKKMSRFIANFDNTSEPTGQRNLLEEMLRILNGEQTQENQLTHKEIQNLSKEQQIEQIIREQREIALINQKQKTDFESILETSEESQSTTEEKTEPEIQEIEKFDIKSFVSIPIRMEWKRDIPYDVLVTDAKRIRYDDSYRSYVGNPLENVEISGTIKNPSGEVIQEFEGVTSSKGKYENKYYIPENVNTRDEYVITINAIKYFSDGSFSQTQSSGVFFVFSDSGSSCADANSNGICDSRE